MDPHRDTNVEYATQYFEFTPKAFCDTMYNTTFNTASSHLQSYLKAIQESHPAVTEEDLEAANSNLHEILSQKMDKCFDIFESYVTNNVFYVPNNVTLPEDSVQSTQEVTSHDMTKLDQEITALQTRLQASRYSSACLRQELTECATVQAEYTKFNHNLDVSTRGVDMDEQLTFLADKCDRILPILRQGKPHMPQQLRAEQDAAMEKFSL